MTQQRQRQQTTSQQMGRNQVHQDFQSAESEDGVTFSGGNMMVNGVAQVPEMARQWESSNGLTMYTTVQWKDPQTDEKRVSCNCTGWAVKKKGKPRQCKHTLDMMGVEPCNARAVNAGQQIRTIRQAEAIVPKFNGQELRGLMLEDD